MRVLTSRPVRILVSAALLVLVLRRAHLGELLERLADAEWSWIGLAFLVSLAGNLFGAWRWKLLLASQGRSVGSPFLFGSYLVGLFFNNILPSTIGGDVFRAASAKRKGGGTLTENLTVVLVERMIGLLATLIVGGVAALSGEAGRLDPRIAWLLGGALALSALGLYVALSHHVRLLVLRVLPRVPVEFVRRTVGKMLTAFELFSRARGALIANLVLSLAFQYVLIVHFWLIQFAFGESVPLITYLVVVPLVFFVMLLPVGINGLGVRESAFVWFLTRAGMDPATALAISLSSYGIAVAQGLVGGAVHFGRQLRADPAEPGANELADPAALPADDPAPAREV